METDHRVRASRLALGLNVCNRAVPKHTAGRLEQRGGHFQFTGNVWQDCSLLVQSVVGVYRGGAEVKVALMRCALDGERRERRDSGSVVFGSMNLLA